jgi:hypothetical protein
MTSPFVGRFAHCVARLTVRLAALALVALCGTTVAVASARVASHRQASGRPAAPGHVVIRGQAPPSAPVPTVSGPVPGAIPPAPPPGAGVNAVDAGALAGFGYQEKEFFISGMANAYDFSQPAGADGRWSVQAVAGSQAAYRTRIVVFTPRDPRKFSGTVMVEWDNVSAGADSLPDLIYDHDTVFRDGDAYVGVSAQFVGVASAQANDPGRYGTLVHPGDSYSYDIFSQAGMALWRDSRQVLGGLRPLALIADGDSQSATRLLTYVDAFAPVFNVYDGYLIHSRMPPSAALQQGPGSASVAVGGPNTLVTVPDGNVGLTTVGTPPITLSRTDLLAPQLTFETQSDVNVPPFGLFGYGPATQADTSGFRLWEVAGTSHLDDCFANLCPTDNGDTTHAVSQLGSMLAPPLAFGSFPACTEPINTGEEDYVLGAALQQLTRWVVTGGVQGGRPAAAPPLFAGQFVGETASPPPVLDGNGDIVGGVRSPAVDVPVATLTGVPSNTPGFCFLAGSTVPFTAATLAQLYPTHGSFVAKWTSDVIRLTREGYLNLPDALNLIQAGARSSIAR